MMKVLGRMILSCKIFHSIYNMKKLMVLIIFLAIMKFLHSWYGDWLWAGQLRGQSLSPSRVKEISLLHVIQTGSGADLASYPMGTGDSFPGGKVAGV
jgi:hypothetical protein